VNGTTGVAVVTGGASGIGLATVKRLYDDGWTVVAADRDPEALAALPDADRIARVQADVTDERQVASLMSRADRRYGGLDAVVTCAGVVRNAPAVEAEATDFRLTLDVNVMGTFLACRGAARHMLRRGRAGSLVTISSVSGLRGGPDRSAYAASKGAVIALTRVLAVELGAAGIRANCVAPGATETPLVSVAQPPPVRRAVLEAIPLGRYARPQETAAVIAFLAGPESGFVTGQVWGVDGGQTAGPGWQIREDS
jgi:NAD(P)-dependent dehydrogenase (short-subunit alcohol dehydrogenase family)